MNNDKAISISKEKPKARKDLRMEVENEFAPKLKNSKQTA